MTRAMRVSLALLLIALVLANCGATSEPEQVIEAVELERAPPAPTAAPTAAPASEESDSRPDSESGRIHQLASLTGASTQRMIIKNAELDLLVSNTDVALDAITVIAVEYRGYIISTHTWYERDYRYATVRLGVPVEEFENVLRRLRGLALRVLNEIASGEDVTDQYVDLQSRLTNLQATQDRIREFLDKATSVEEALQVNEQLSQVEGQIEEIQGRMNYLQDRAAYSTIDIQLSPEVPTPTPSPTPTPRPTSTPEAWHPGETIGSATDTLAWLSRGLADLAIWVVIVLGPFLAVLAALAAVAIWWRRRSRRVRSQPETDVDEA